MFTKDIKKIVFGANGTWATTSTITASRMQEKNWLVPFQVYPCIDIYQEYVIYIADGVLTLCTISQTAALVTGFYFK